VNHIVRVGEQCPPLQLIGKSGGEDAALALIEARAEGVVVLDLRDQSLKRYLFTSVTFMGVLFPVRWRRPSVPDIGSG
jgi:hypothetical protein